MEHIYAIWLLAIAGPGNRHSPALCEYFGSFEEIYAASRKEYENSGILNEKQIDKLMNKDLGHAGEIAGKCETLGIDIITCYDVKYPSVLKNIPDFPILLFVQGNLPNINSLCIGVVGSRRPSIYGTRMAENISCDLGSAGAVIISGMARGIDTCSHKGALKAGAKTIAVLGCGLDIVYPPENRSLKELISQDGAVISEFLPSTPPTPQHFPMRNRIISGMSDAILIVEGKATSGSTITANLAKEQGREVFCLPGNADNPMSAAPNQLIREGARLVTCAQDILIDMAADNPEHIVETIYGNTAREANKTAKLNGLTSDQRKIAGVLDCNMPMHVDKICFSTGIEIAVVNQCLFMMELDGIVKQLPGKQYILCL